jgi:GntR family transcriptional repressor for pyruvate dehydrogenase complex
MFAQPIRTSRTFEAAITNILEAIERARMRLGDRLPSEDDLAAQLGISRPTLRQALRVLEQAGLLEIRAGKGGGIFMASDLVPSEAISRTVELEEDAVIDVLRGRRILEAAVTALAARTAGDDDFDEIERTIGLMGDHLGDRALVMQADGMFHRAVVRACHNATLQGAMAAVASDLAPIRDAYQGGKEADQVTLDIHSRQLHAMRKGDWATLARVLDEHFRMLEEEFARIVRRDWSDLFGDIAEQMHGIATSGENP